MDLGLTVSIDRVCDELTVVDELLALDARRILELGCGRGEKTRAIAQSGRDRSVVALEVDEVQHARNLQIEDLPNVRFGFGGAERIPAEDRSFDVVLLFKSLHHVPVEAMGQAMAEIARVLLPGGFAYISEPLFRGDFNEVLRLFHDESRVRRHAFEAVVAAVGSGQFELVSQTFFQAPVRFADFAEFDRLVIGATHSKHVLSDATREQVKATFGRFAGEQGASFEQPIRVDLLRRPVG